MNVCKSHENFSEGDYHEQQDFLVAGVVYNYHRHADAVLYLRRRDSELAQLVFGFCLRLGSFRFNVYFRQASAQITEEVRS